MIEIIYSFLCKKLGEPIVNEFIMPYSYQTQSKELLTDIRNYVTDRNICNLEYPEERYPTNEQIFLFYHLVDFSMNNNIKNNKRVGKIIKYFKNERNKHTINKTNCQDVKHVTNLFLAALTYTERDTFINNYVICEDFSEEDDITIQNNVDWFYNGNYDDWL